MASTTGEVAYDFPNFIRIYKDGRIERLAGTAVVPPSTDPVTGVESKDVVIVPDTGVSVRLYKPKPADLDRKLPLLVYFHGGGFIIESASSPVYHNYLNSLAAEAGVVVVSVDYRLAPEHPLPASYDDCWAALKWVASHADGDGGEAWLKDHADFNNVFFAGDSAGANISHRMALRVGTEGLSGVKLAGIALIHPYFWGKDPIGAEPERAEVMEIIKGLWLLACPSSSGMDDPLINPSKGPNLSTLVCSRVLVCVAGKDALRDRGRKYCEELQRTGWAGAAELVEVEDEDHVFHLLRPGTDNAMAMLKKVASFMNEVQS